MDLRSWSADRILYAPIYPGTRKQRNMMQEAIDQSSTEEGAKAIFREMLAQRHGSGREECRCPPCRAFHASGTAGD